MLTSMNVYTKKDFGQVFGMIKLCVAGIGGYGIMRAGCGGVFCRCFGHRLRRGHPGYLRFCDHVRPAAGRIGL